MLTRKRKVKEPAQRRECAEVTNDRNRCHSWESARSQIHGVVSWSNTQGERRGAAAGD